MVFGLILFQSNPSQAKEKLVATPINSPVKETYLKVKLEGFSSISEVLFKPKNGGSETAGEVVKEGSAYIGKFKASFLSPGKYEYRVKIRTASGGSQQNEAASVAFINFEIDSSLGVADPGEAGKKTLAGIDSDNDGVRDDVQRWINEEYPMSTSPSTHQALKQGAKTMQAIVLNSENRAAAIQAQIKDLEAASCLWWIKGADTKIEKLARAHFYNTPERIQANFRVQAYGEEVLVQNQLKALILIIIISSANFLQQKNNKIKLGQNMLKF
jgi:hypothetical protein